SSAPKPRAHRRRPPARRGRKPRDRERQERLYATTWLVPFDRLVSGGDSGIGALAAAAGRIGFLEMGDHFAGAAGTGDPAEAVIDAAFAEAAVGGQGAEAAGGDAARGAAIGAGRQAFFRRRAIG